MKGCLKMRTFGVVSFFFHLIETYSYPKGLVIPKYPSCSMKHTFVISRTNYSLMYGVLLPLVTLLRLDQLTKYKNLLATTLFWSRNYEISTTSEKSSLVDFLSDTFRSMHRNYSILEMIWIASSFTSRPTRKSKTPHSFVIVIPVWPPLYVIMRAAKDFNTMYVRKNTI